MQRAVLLLMARHPSRTAAGARYWIHVQLGTSKGSRKGSIRRLLLVLASAIRIDGGAANDRQQKRMLWLRDNKFILDVILDTPDALSHVIGHASALNPLNFPPHCITRHRSVREVLPAVQRLLPSPPPARSIPPGELPSVPPHPHAHHFMRWQMVAASGVHFDR